MKKIIAIISFILCNNVWAGAVVDGSSLQFIKEDAAGNKVYIADAEDDKFIFTDGGESVGKFAATSIKTMLNDGVAGYGVIPAKTVQEMSDNADFGKIYTVDCDMEKVTDENGQVVRLSDMNTFHQTAAKVACEYFEQK